MAFDQLSITKLAAEVRAADWHAATDLARQELGTERNGPDLFIRTAEILSQADEIEAAKDFLEEGLRRWPDDPWLGYWLVELGTSHDDFDAVANRWKALITRYPEFAPAQCGLANLYRKAGREMEAGKLFAEAANLYPEEVWIADGHAVTSAWARDWSEAVRRWQTVCNTFPDHMRGHFGLIEALVESDLLEEADDALSRALVKHPASEFAKLTKRLDDKKSERSVEAFVESVFQHLIQREPTPDESDQWVAHIKSGMPEREFYRQVLNFEEYGRRPRVIPGHTPGNYYSPIVDPVEAEPYWRRSVASTVADLDGIKIDLGAMERFWQVNVEFMASMGFAEKPGGRNRYYLENGLYPNGDALVLAGMINHYKPRRIMEIGSGFSSAVMLDTIDRLKPKSFHLTCIDPDTSRLRALLREDEKNMVSVIEDMVQNVPVSTFAELQPNDILFIDSSHVMKTGSDLHYEMFSILPVLKPGVIIHFHDIHFPFEYPETWALKFRWAWNEVYAVRAFLAYNSEFQVLFFTDLFLKQRAELTKGVIPGDRWPMTPLIGASMWLSRRPKLGNAAKGVSFP